MKILYVDLEREWRGGQSQALLTLCGIRDAGHSIELVSPKGAPLSQRAAESGIVVHVVPQLGSRLWASFAIRRLLSARQFDIIHVNEPHALTSAWLARAHHKAPVVLSRRIGFPLKKNWVARSRYGSLSRFLANCTDVQDSLLRSGVAASRVSIVNEGVEVPTITSPEAKQAARKHWRISEKDFLFGCVSVFVPEKGQRHLISALAILRNQFPQARLLLAGDGACRGELEDLTRRLNQSGAVIFAGFVKDVSPVYAALDAYVFPSEFEGLGTALQTAMALALPCISTARGGLREVVDNERTALVVEPEAKQFAAAMARVIVDQGLRERLGSAARAEIQRRFSNNRMVERTLEVYSDVIAAK